ncbi:MAG: IclR family transcriptional regulator [Lentisphaeraceae bacterium]|nr:IclR family transcriptional regulator [Lentisphaeraceae bacterium]
MTKEANYSVPNLERALSIMEHLSQSPEGATQAEICAHFEYPKNSVYRICSSLVDRGYLQKNNTSQKFTLTRKLLAVAYGALSEDNLLELALPIMRRIRPEVQETLLLGTLLDDEGLVLAELAGTHHFNFRVERGARFYLHCTAPGKAILAFLPEDEQQRYLDSIDFIAFNERTHKSKASLKKELDEIKLRGVSYDYAEQLDGCHCISTPVFDQQGYPIAALWTTGPSSRLTADSFEDMGEVLKSATLEISQHLCYKLLEDNK